MDLSENYTEANGFEIYCYLFKNDSIGCDDKYVDIQNFNGEANSSMIECFLFKNGTIDCQDNEITNEFEDNDGANGTIIDCFLYKNGSIDCTDAFSEKMTPFNGFPIECYQ